MVLSYDVLSTTEVDDDDDEELSEPEDGYDEIVRNEKNFINDETGPTARDIENRQRLTEMWK